LALQGAFNWLLLTYNVGDEIRDSDQGAEVARSRRSDWKRETSKIDGRQGLRPLAHYQPVVAFLMDFVNLADRVLEALGAVG
jgi:hypothetical protein